MADKIKTEQLNTFVLEGFMKLPETNDLSSVNARHIAFVDFDLARDAYSDLLSKLSPKVKYLSFITLKINHFGWENNAKHLKNIRGIYFGNGVEHHGKKLPSEFNEMENLERLLIYRSAKLKNGISKEAFALKHLQIFVFSHSNLVEFHTDWFKKKGLDQLEEMWMIDLSDNDLKNLPSDFASVFPNLRKLRLQRNKFVNYDLHAIVTSDLFKKLEEFRFEG